jgi:EAL domain-containing protein (putative c-di-GMP-specific phosphodiesterase class I)
VRDMRLAQEIAAQLRGSGINIAIDDFGAGYSSFSSLRELPFIELKLDGSFVKNCATDVSNAAICQTAVDLLTGSAAQRLQRASRTPPICRRSWSWAAILARGS